MTKEVVNVGMGLLSFINNNNINNNSNEKKYDIKKSNTFELFARLIKLILYLNLNLNLNLNVNVNLYKQNLLFRLKSFDLELFSMECV